jgi:hypothetical protein
MDKFRVGQKVKLINSDTVPHFIGNIYVITEPKLWRTGLGGEIWEGYGVNQEEFTLEGREVTLKPKEEHLAPVYDGDEKSSWKECEWKPDSHRVQIKVGEEGIEAKGYTGESFPA